MPRSDRRAAAVNDNARSVAASETMLRRASLHRACMLSSLTKNIRCVMKLRSSLPPVLPTTADQSRDQFTDLRYKSKIMVPPLTQTLLKKLALSLDWGPNISV